MSRNINSSGFGVLYIFVVFLLFLLFVCCVRRPSSICLFCVNRFFYHRSGWMMDRHQTCTRWSPEEPASRVCSRSRSRSKVTWYGHFCDFTKIAYSHRQMAGSPPNLHTMVHRRACIQGVLKIKDHVIRTLVISRKSLFLAGKWLDRDHCCQTPKA